MFKKTDNKNKNIDWNKIFDLDETLVDSNQHQNEKSCLHQSTSKQQSNKTDIDKRYNSTLSNTNKICEDDEPLFDFSADSGLFSSFETDTFLDIPHSQPFSNLEEILFWSQVEPTSTNENSPESINTPVLLAQENVEDFEWRDSQIANENHVAASSLCATGWMHTNTPAASLYQQPSDIPESVLTLVTKIKSQFTDHAVVYAMAAQMCQTVLPMDAYVSLKIALLLSLISNQNSTDISPISIMAIGSDSSSIFKIMNEIGQCAETFELASSNLRNMRSKYNKGVELNSLISARKGVCYLGDWLGQQPATQNYIRQVLDSGRIPMENSSIGEPLQCSIWSYWSCYTKNMRKNINDLATFLSVFGIPITLEENDSDSIVDYLLEMAVTGNPPDVDQDLYIPNDDMKYLLYFIGSIAIEMSKEAEDLLKSYFLATRSLRPDILSQRAYLILRQFAESYARLCLRSVVLKDDAIASIAIAENYILKIFGCEMSSAPPRMSFTNIEQVDEYMRSFQGWLYSYINDSKNSDLRML